MGKGSWSRVKNKTAFDQNFDQIFNKNQKKDAQNKEDDILYNSDKQNKDLNHDDENTSS